MPDADRTVLDHVAHAADAHELLLPRYAAELGGRYVGHGDGFGFSPLQVRFANGAKVELLRPHDEDRNPFLRRFLDRHGPGLHHATFKVPDIRATIAELEGRGFAVVDVNLEFDGWQEAFVHPKSAYGFLVQIAQAATDMPSAGPPPGFPDAGGDADLVRLALAVPSVDAALQLYRDVLGGTVVDEGAGFVDLDHGSPARVRLAEHAGEPGGPDHLAFRVGDPSAVEGAVERDGHWEVPASANHGARLVLLP